jgi:hypothetical protein
MVMFRKVLGLMVTGLIGAAGCTSTDAHLKPPKPPEEYNTPPDTDPRYLPGAKLYPKDVMDDDPLVKKARDKAANAGGLPGSGRMGGPNGFGMGGSAGGY